MRNVGGMQSVSLAVATRRDHEGPPVSTTRLGVTAIADDP
jgi:hypothetical protein